MNSVIPRDGIGDWSPKTPDKSRDTMMKLMEPDAKDAPDSINATNELKNFVGGKGAQSDPLGSKGRSF